MQLRVFKDRTYAAGVFLMTMLGFVLYGSLLLLPIFLQTMLGYPALNAGIAMAPRGLGSFLMMPLVGTVLGRFDPRKVLAAGWWARPGRCISFPISISTPATGIFSGRSSFRARRWRCCSCR